MSTVNGGGNLSYQVIKCGASGHNIRSKPNLKAPPIGMLILGNKIGITEFKINNDGCWVLLDQPTMKKYCFNYEQDDNAVDGDNDGGAGGGGEAWSLAIGQNNVKYIDQVANEPNEEDGGNLSSEIYENQTNLTEITELFDSYSRSSNSSSSGDFVPKTNKRGFDFTTPTKTPNVKYHQETSSKTSNPFVFGRADSVKSAKESCGELSGIAALNKLISESKNGNGVTPPDTPKRSPKLSRELFKFRIKKSL